MIEGLNRLTKKALSMHYRQFAPSVTLRSTVECYWMLDAPAGANPGRERLPADGRVEILFNLGDDSRRHTADDSSQPVLMRHAYVMGMRTQGYLIEQCGASRYVSIRFRPGALSAFTRLPADEITDRVLGLDDLWTGADFLTDRLASAASDAERVSLLDRALLQRLAPPTGFNLIQHSLNRLRADTEVSIRELADHYGYSQRQLERLFLAQVGVTPRLSARILRFQHAVDAMTLANTSSPMPLNDLAVHLNFYDQSHLTNEFRRFSGATPKQFLHSPNGIVDLYHFDHASAAR